MIRPATTPHIGAGPDRSLDGGGTPKPAEGAPPPPLNNPRCPRNVRRPARVPPAPPPARRPARTAGGGPP
jgi:hypothetical protein